MLYIYIDKLQTQKRRQTHKHPRQISGFFLSFNLHTIQAEEKKIKDKEKVIHMHNTKHYLQNTVNIDRYLYKEYSRMTTALKYLTQNKRENKLTV